MIVPSENECDDAQSFRFRLAEDANVVTLDHPARIEQLPLLRPYAYREKADPGPNPTLEELEAYFAPGEHAHPDFEAMAARGVDAVELFWSPLFRDALWGWDCNCLLVLSADIVEVE